MEADSVIWPWGSKWYGLVSLSSFYVSVSVVVIGHILTFDNFSPLRDATFVSTSKRNVIQILKGYGVEEQLSLTQIDKIIHQVQIVCWSVLNDSSQSPNLMTNIQGILPVTPSDVVRKKCR